MHPSGILREARQLRSVSDRLDSLAEKHPLVSEALIAIEGNVRLLRATYSTRWEAASL